MKKPKQRRLTPTQQGYVELALLVVQPSIATFVKRNPDLRGIIGRCDL